MSVFNTGGTVYPSLTLILLILTSFAFADDRCVTLKQSVQPITKSMNVVLVPSGFNSNMDEFESKVRSSFEKMETLLPPFSSDVTTMNIILAKIPNKKDSFCKVNDQHKIDCDFLTPPSLVSKCFSGGKKITVVVHNSTDGWTTGNAQSGRIELAYSAHFHLSLAHELGHALFELADEYPNAPDNGLKRNCSSVEMNCSRWQDLIDKGMASCQPGCSGNKAMSDGNNLMKKLDTNTFGHANQRLICCQINKQTGVFPAFCDEYRHIGVGLEKFCR